jgi:hypothetical protein
LLLEDEFGNIKVLCYNKLTMDGESLLPLSAVAPELLTPPSEAVEVGVEPVAQDPSFFDRLKDTFSAIPEDYRQSDSRLKLIAAGVGTTALQIADRFRLSTIIVPQVAINVLTNTNSPTQAAIASGLTFGAWCAAVGGATAVGLEQFPKTINTFSENFPGAVDVFEDALPGINDFTPEGKREGRLVRRIGGRALTAVRRGATVSGIGTVAYVSTAATQGQSRSAVRKLNIAGSLEGGGVVGAVVFGVGEAIQQVGEHNPALAQHIENVASDTRIWYGLAGAMIVSQFVSSRIKKFRARHNASAPEESGIDQAESV